MRPMVVVCPSCGGTLAATRLRCSACAIAIEGEFSLPPLLKLSPAQLDFVQVFIKNRGVIRDVERELGVSYPTVRARLDEVVRALGFQTQDSANEHEAEKQGDENRRKLLDDLKSGRSSIEQTLTHLRQRGGSGGRAVPPEKKDD